MVIQKLAGLSLIAASALSVGNVAQAQETSPELAPRLIRTCTFDVPNSEADCWARIIRCPVETVGKGDPCYDYLYIRCGDRTVFRGDYTEDREGNVVRVTAGAEPMPGAPFILHAAPTSIPSTVVAALRVGESTITGSCAVREDDK